MKKILFSLVMSFVMVFGLYAKDYTANSMTNAVGQTFMRSYFRSAGASEYLRYTVTFTVTKAYTSSSLGTLEVTSVQRDGSEKLGNETWEMYYHLTNSNGTLIGNFMVTSFAKDVLSNQTTLTSLTLDYENQAIWQLNLGAGAFYLCSGLTSIKQKSNSVAARDAKYEGIGSSAFTGCTALKADTVEFSGTVGSNAFTNTNIKCLRMTSSSAGMEMNAMVAMKSLTRLEVYTTNLASNLITATSDVPNLKTIKVLGGTKNYSSGTSPFYPIRSQVTTVVMGGSIPDYTFYGFTALKTISAPGDLCKGSNNPKIGSYAFGNCTALTLAAIGGIVDQRAFTGCTALKTIYWRGGDPWDGGTSAGKMTQSPLYAMRSTITRVNFDADFGLTTVPDYICYGLTNLKEVWIGYPKSGKIGYGAFEGCTALTTVDMSDEQGEPVSSTYRYTIGDRAFYGCTALKTINEFPDGVQSIGKNAFYNTTSLTECPVTQYNTALTTIGEGAFQRSAITSLVIPSSVTTLGGKLAGGTGSNLQTIYYLPSTLTRKMAGGSYANLFIETSTGSTDQSDKGKVTTAYLNSSLAEIPDSLFFAYRSLSAVKGIKGDGSNTQKFTALKKIGNYAFYYGRGLTTIQNVEPLYNDKLEEIGVSAFEQSDINYSLYLCTNLKRIEKRAFCNTMMTQFNMGNTTTDYTKNELPNLTYIGEEAFLDNQKMTLITLPQNLSSIGKDAFAKKSSYALKGDPISTVVYAIKSYPYNNPLGDAMDLSKVDKVLIAENVTSIPMQAFKGSAIKGVTIPAYVNKIDSAAFADCASLDSVIIKGSTTGQQTNANFLDSKTAPFSRSALRKVIFDDNVTTIGRCLLANTPKLTTVVMGKKLATIDQYAFTNTGLTEFTFSNITTINSYAFSNNSKLKELTIAGTAPSTVSSTAFNGTTITTIWTTCTNHSAVSSNSTWKAVCSNIKQKDNAYEAPDFWDWAIGGQGQIKITKELDCDGVLIAEAVANTAEGYYFVQWTDGNKENPRTFNMAELGSWFGYPYFDNEKLYTLTESDFKVVQLPYANIGEIKVYDNQTQLENTRGKYKPQTSYIFVPQPAADDSWYEFSKWEYDMTYSAVTPYPWVDPDTYIANENALEVRFEYMPGDPIETIDEWGNPIMEMGPEVPNFPSEITAQYTPRALPVELRVCSNGGGTFKFEGSAVIGQEITLTAVPDENYELDHWGDDKSATSLEYKVTITPEMLYEAALMPEQDGTPVYNANTKTLEPYQETAQYYAMVCVWFKQKAGLKFTITAEAQDPSMGEVTGGGEYANGATATLTAVPAEGYQFSKWTDGNTDNPRKVSVTKDAKYIAVFTQKSGDNDDPQVSYVCDFTKQASKNQQYTNEWTYDNDWTVFGGANNNGGWAYAKFGGKSANLATANPVYVVNNKAFDKDITQVRVTFPAGSFGKDGMSLNNWGVKVYSDLACTKLLYTVEGKEFTKEAAVISVSAKSGQPWSAGYAVQVYWDVANTTATNGVVWVEKIEYLTGGSTEPEDVYYNITVTATPAEGGQVTGSGSYKENTVATLTAVANAGYEFVQWSDGNTSASRTITVTKDETFVANFKKADEPEVFFNITVVSANPNEGTVEGSGSYLEGSVIQIEAVPNTGYKFAQWSDGNTDNPRTITVTDNAIYVASFKKIDDALEDIFGNDQPQVRKVMIDGQIYIIRGEKMFNILGAEVR